MFICSYLQWCTRKTIIVMRCKYNTILIKLLTSSSSSRTLFIQKHMAIHISTAPEATSPTPIYRTAGTGFVWWSANPSQLNNAPMHTSVIPNRYGRCDSSGTISAISGRYLCCVYLYC